MVGYRYYQVTPEGVQPKQLLTGTTHRTTLSRPAKYVERPISIIVALPVIVK